jgi:catechol 2,3-dioxygenase-like lactoylglutathione lyase family enzyme
MPNPLPLKSLHHVARRTKHLEQSIAFYRDVLGFREIPRPALGFSGAWLFNYSLQIHLLYDETIGDPAGQIYSRDDHLAFFTDDVAAVERLLTEHGVPFRVNIQADTGLKQIFFRDPDGHHVEVATYPATVEGGLQ